jgi:hypothetical protein
MAKRAKKEEVELSEVGKLMVKNTLEEDKLKQEILSDLKKNPKYKEFFSTYNKQTVQAFIKHFADAKWRYLKYGEMYLKKEDEETSRYKFRAEQYFWQIQQKKLFDKQCLWRAEKIQIPEIQLSNEFNYWEEAVKTCPFIDPVTETEFNLFLEFINSEYFEFDNDYEYCSWQSYYMVFEDDESLDEDMPGWYQFHNKKTGSGELMKLPDIRGTKESKYIKFASKERMEIYKEEHPEYNEDNHDKRPSISFGNDELISFIKRFEDPVLLKYHALIDRGEYDDNDLPGFSKALEDLKNAEIPIPVSEGASWQETIINSMAEHELRMLNKALPIVFDEYLFRVQNNIAMGYSDKEIESQERNKKTLDDNYRKSILQGRKLNGEPEDLNF